MSKKLFITERTKMWRTRELEPTFVEAIDTIEEFGCQVMHIRADSTCPSFSYTVGVTDTCGKPELITVGLMEKTAHHALNESVALMKRGINLSKGRHRDIVGDVEVEFRAVDTRWLHHIMLRTNWFYEGADVPVPTARISGSGESIRGRGMLR